MGPAMQALHGRIQQLLDEEVAANPVSYTTYRNMPYQAYERIGLEGVRWSVEKRIREYGLERFYNSEQAAIDIGSNMGLFVVEFAHHFRLVHGLEPTPQLNQIGREVADHLGLGHKVRFFDQTFEEFEAPMAYDVAFSLAAFYTADGRQRSTADYYFGKIRDMLAPGGRLFYESTSYNKDPQSEIHEHYPVAEQAIASIRRTFREVEDWETSSGRHDENNRRFAVAVK